MIVVKLLFAVGAVVKVFTNCTLVADSKDRGFATTVAGNTNMGNDLILFRGWFFRFLNIRNFEANTFVF